MGLTDGIPGTESVWLSTSRGTTDAEGVGGTTGSGKIGFFGGAA